MAATLLSTDFLTPDQAAEYLSIRPQTLAKWRCCGQGPRFVRVGRLIRYRLADLESYVEAHVEGGESA